MNTIGRVDVPRTEEPLAGSYSRARADFLLHVRARNRRTRVRRFVRGVTGILLILLAWQLMSQIMDLELLLPQPLTVLRNVVTTLTVSNPHWLYGPNIYVHLSHSFLRAMTGFVMAALAAIPLGLALGRITVLREFVMPSIQVIYPSGNRVDPTGDFVVWPGQPGGGVRGIGHHVLPDAVQCRSRRAAHQPDGAGCRPLLRRARTDLLLPRRTAGDEPYIITGLRISLGGAWRMIVAGEMLASQDGIGYVLMESRFQFRAVDLMTTMILVAIVGYATEKLIVDPIEKRTIEKWEVQPS